LTFSQCQRQQSLIRIVIDDREARSNPARILQKMDGVQATVARLSLGDYWVNQAILFERKTLVDFIASIKDGRLFRQARRLSAQPAKCAIILEGTSADLQATRMKREAIQGALITLTILFGIPLLRSRAAEETARLLVYTAQQLRTFATGAHLRHGKRPRGKRKLQLYILQGMPGIGPERASRLLDCFGSIQAVVNAPLADLICVKGIGRQVARKIRWAVDDS